MDLLEKECLKCDKNFQQGDIWNYYHLSDKMPAQGWKINTHKFSNQRCCRYF